MNASERDELIRRMEEAVLLPPGDPVRQQMCCEVVEAGEWARQYWLELVRSDEKLRLELLDVEPPAGMEQRLRSLADEPAGSEPSRVARGPLLSRRGLLGMAASVAALASVGSVAWLREGRSLEARFAHLGEAVGSHHAHPHAVDLATSDPTQAVAHFAGAFEWDVRLPTMDASYEFIGASRCRLNGEPVLCTQWNDRDGRRYSIFQFCAPDHGLPEQFDRRTVEVPMAGSRRGEVTFWTEAHCAYVMIPDPPADHRPSV